MHETEKMAQLTAAIETLTQVVANNEKRYQRLEGAVRWFGLGMLGLVLTVVLTQVEWVERSHATPGGVNASAPVSGAAGGMGAMEMLAQAGMTPEKIVQLLPVILGGMENAAIVMNRVKQDSDVLRAYALSRNEPPIPMVRQILANNQVPTPSGLDSIEASPALIIHRAREALGAMAGNMQSMAYSMGSTMGRMGSWMP